MRLRVVKIIFTFNSWLVGFRSEHSFQICSYSGEVSLQRVTFFVLDEADRMLECGFEEQVGRIGKMPGSRTGAIPYNRDATW